MTQALFWAPATSMYWKSFRQIAIVPLPADFIDISGKFWNEMVGTVYIYIEWASARVPPTPFFGGAAGLLRLLRGAQNVPRSSFEAQ